MSQAVAGEAINPQQVGMIVAIEILCPDRLRAWTLKHGAVCAGVSYSQSGGGPGGPSQVTFGLFTLTKLIDGISPQLLISAASGQTFSQAAITLYVPGGNLVVLTTYELSDIVVRGAVVNSVPNGQQYSLIEQVSLDYGRIKQTVFTAAGTVVGCWDRVQNRAC
jgi:type VI protein secretion system component Hcp